MNGVVDFLWVLEGRMGWREIMDLDVSERSHIIRRVSELKEAETEEIEAIRTRNR